MSRGKIPLYKLKSSVEGMFGDHRVSRCAKVRIPQVDSQRGVGVEARVKWSF